MHRVALSLGTNCGDRCRAMDTMLELLGEILTPPFRVSSLMETEPLGVRDIQPWYYNRIVSGGCDGSARHLFDECRQIENRLGRTGKNLCRPRTADIDILLFGSSVINDPDLVIPHPRILERRFCIEGIRSLEPAMIHPVIQKSFEEVYRNMTETILAQKIHFIGA